MLNNPRVEFTNTTYFTSLLSPMALIAIVETSLYFEYMVESDNTGTTGPFFPLPPIKSHLP